MYHEPFFVIDVVMTGTASVGTIIKFLVSGSTQTNYVVSITSGGEVTCSCKDAMIHCRRDRCVCKHACFVVFRVMRIETLGLLETLRLRPAEVRAISIGVVTNGMHWESRYPEHVLSSAEVSDICSRNEEPRAVDLTKQFAIVLRMPEKGDECPICYDLLEGVGQEEMRGCPDCGRGIHAKCVNRWIANSARATCVFCRSSVWEQYA